MNPDRFPSQREMIRDVDRYVVGQRQAKLDLALAIERHYLGRASWNDASHFSLPFGRVVPLLLGPTGVGKSHLVESFARAIGVPYLCQPATSLTEEGYVGPSVGDMLGSLFDLPEVRSNPELASWSCIFIDEIDKCACQRATQRDISGLGVLQALLPLLQGNVITLHDRKGHEGSIDTSRLLFVFAGAFVGLTELIRERLGTPSTSPRLSDDEALARVTPRDLQAFGVIPEFVGRMSSITPLHSLDEGDLVAIMTSSHSGARQDMARFFQSFGIELEFTPDALHAVARMAIKDGTGARALNQQLLRALGSTPYQLDNLAAEGVCRVIVDAHVVLEGTPPRLQRLIRPAAPTEAQRLRTQVHTALSGQGPAQPTASSPPRQQTQKTDGPSRRTKNDVGFATASHEAQAFWLRLERSLGYQGTQGQKKLDRVLEALVTERVALEQFFRAVVPSKHFTVEQGIQLIRSMRNGTSH